MPTALLEHLRHRALRHGEEPGEVDRDDVGVVLGGVIGERLGDEDASVVDQRVDPAELTQALADDRFGGGGIADVTLNGKHADVFRRLDGARVRDYRVAEFPVCGDERLSDSLRGPGDDGNLLDLVTHEDSSLLAEEGEQRLVDLVGMGPGDVVRAAVDPYQPDVLDQVGEAVRGGVDGQDAVLGAVHDQDRYVGRSRRKSVSQVSTQTWVA